MVNKIIYFSLHNRVAILVGVVLLILGGVYTANKMDIDVFPDLTAPQVVVMTDCHGMASEEVEKLVTFPIETALNGATNVRRVRSASNFGYSFVWAEFDWGMDVFRARQIVSEKMVSLSSELPEGITPELAPQSSVMGEILFVGLQVDSLKQLSEGETPTNMMDLRSLADWVIKPAILATGGVSQVTIIGGDYKQYQVLAEPLLMDAYGVTMDELAATVKTMSQNSEGGVIRDFGNEYALRGMGRTNDVEELSKTVIKTVKKEGQSSMPVTVGDVAKIQIAPAVKMGTGSMNGHPAIILSVSKQPNINTLDVTRKIEANLDNVRKSLPSDVNMNTNIFRQADFIEASVSNVGEALIEGAILCIIILFLFLGSMRTTIISVVAIPLSLLGTIIILWALGMDINTMTLGGMCIAIGSLVDDAIIDVENVYKRLKQNHAKPLADRTPVVQVVFDASKEIRSSILNATFIVMVAFVPMFFLSGLEGRMLKPLGITYIISLFMSLIVAMTVTPLFCRQILTSDKYLQKKEQDRGFVVKMLEVYGNSLEWVLNHKHIVMGGTLSALVIAIIVMMTFGSSFLPDFNEGALTISAVCKPGVSLEESDNIGRMLEARIHEVPEVTSTSRRTGRGELDEHSQTTNSMEIDVNFGKSSRGKDEIMQDVRAHMAMVPGVATIVGQPLGHRIDHMVSGTRANIAIKLFGTDLSEMYMIGCKIKKAISGIEGCVDVNVDQQVQTPQLHIRPNRTALARYGITMEEFNELVVLGFSGEKIGDIYEGQRSYDLVLRLDPAYTGSIEGVRKALIDTGDGHKVPLEDVCEIVSSSGPNTIARENVQRKLVIATNTSGRDVGSVVNDIKNVVENEITLPEGYRIEYGGQFESAQSARRILIIATLIALIIIYLLLYGEFKSFSLSGIVMAGLPLSLIGGVIGIALTSWVLSIPSMIGFITLFGIATRNGILLISRYQHGTGSLRENIVEGSKDRLNPILMTALTSALALIPLVMNGDKAGNEIQSPMAIVVLGGLITSTLLNIYVMPVIFEWQANRKNNMSQAENIKDSKANLSLKALAIAFALTIFFAPSDSHIAQAQDFSAILNSIEQHSTKLNAQRMSAEAQKLESSLQNVLDAPEIGYNYLWGNGNIGDRQDVNVSQSFDFPSTIIMRHKFVKEQQRVADLQYLTARQQLLIKAKKLCIEVVYCNAMMDHLNEDLAETRAMSDSYEKLYEKGEATIIDHNKAHQAVLFFDAEYREFLTMKNNLLAQLKFMNGGEDVVIKDSVFQHSPLPADFDQWLAENIAQRPEKQLADAELSAQKKALTVSKNEWLPKLRVGYMSEKEKIDHYQGLTFGVSVPVWGGIRKVKAAKAHLAASEMEAEDVRQELETQLRATYEDALQLQQTYSIYTQHLTGCDNTELLNKSLNAGQITLLTYLQERQYVHEMHEKLLEAERDLELRKAELNF